MSRISIGAPDDDANEIVLDYATVDQGVGFTKRLLGYTEPYERFVNIFGDVTYTWDSDFINLLVQAIETGIYPSDWFNIYEQKIAEDYIAYKFKSGIEASELIIALDEHLGAL